MTSAKTKWKKCPNCGMQNELVDLSTTMFVRGPYGFKCKRCKKVYRQVIGRHGYEWAGFHGNTVQARQVLAAMRK